jgi:hypothetical protein
VESETEKEWPVPFTGHSKSLTVNPRRASVGLFSLRLPSPLAVLRPEALRHSGLRMALVLVHSGVLAA